MVLDTLHEQAALNSREGRGKRPGKVLDDYPGMGAAVAHESRNWRRWIACAGNGQAEDNGGGKASRLRMKGERLAARRECGCRGVRVAFMW